MGKRGGGERLHEHRNDTTSTDSQLNKTCLGFCKGPNNLVSHDGGSLESRRCTTAFTNVFCWLWLSTRRSVESHSFN